MNKSNKKGNKKAKKFEFKTFPVQFKLEEIEANHTNKINSSSTLSNLANLSKEQWVKIMQEYKKLNEAWGNDDE